VAPVAEHVLAAARYAATGHIGLAPAPDGFQTPPFGADGAYLAVDGTDLVVGDAAGARRTPLTTIRAAASFAGITAGAPAQVYRPRHHSTWTSRCSSILARRACWPAGTASARKA
jgi:hypothetical protein